MWWTSIYCVAPYHNDQYPPKCFYQWGGACITDRSHWKRGISGRKEASGCSRHHLILRHEHTRISKIVRLAKVVPISTNSYPGFPYGVRYDRPLVCRDLCGFTIHKILWVVRQSLLSKHPIYGAPNRTHDEIHPKSDQKITIVVVKGHWAEAFAAWGEDHEPISFTAQDFVEGQPWLRTGLPIWLGMGPSPITIWVGFEQLLWFGFMKRQW